MQFAAHGQNSFFRRTGTKTLSVLPLAVALQIATSCAASVAPETLLSVIKTESGFETLAIGDNTDRHSFHPGSLEDAVALARRLTAAGHNLDLGLAQINQPAGHLQRRGLSVADAFDPCTSLRVGGEVLADCYRHASGGDEQARLRAAVGCYNSGSVERGGNYVGRVQAAAAQVVPALRVAGDSSVVNPLAPPAVTPAPPSWDVWNYAEWQETRGSGAAPSVSSPAVAPPDATLPRANQPARDLMPPGPSEAAPVVLQASRIGATE